MFDVSKSKFYSQLMVGFSKFFGLDENTASEAEIDQRLQSAGTLADIQENAKNEALLTVQNQMNDFTARLTSLESTLSERDASILQLNEQVQAKETEIETLRASVAEREQEVANSKDRITQLAGEVSALKVGKQVDKEPGESAPQYGTVNSPVSVVKAETLNTRFKLN